ncbi:ASF1-like anti-silencing family protein [Populus alba x Populus x berolinensis]|nr:ASF1-like anti-silencing family protein [Populus alba x Populus x berolinensis]
MSAVNLTNVTVLDNPAPFLSPFQFEISYECLTPLKDDLEWKLIYVGSAEDETYDQLLESVLVGPVNVGNYRFVLQAILFEHLFRFFKSDSYFVSDLNKF